MSATPSASNSRDRSTPSCGAAPRPTRSPRTADTPPCPNHQPEDRIAFGPAPDPELGRAGHNQQASKGQSKQPALSDRAKDQRQTKKKPGRGKDERSGTFMQSGGFERGPPLKQAHQHERASGNRRRCHLRGHRVEQTQNAAEQCDAARHEPDQPSLHSDAVDGADLRAIARAINEIPFEINSIASRIPSTTAAE